MNVKFYRWPAVVAFGLWLTWLGLGCWLNWAPGWVASVGIVGAFLVLSIGAEIETKDKEQ